jgi:hypothetical protein
MCFTKLWNANITWAWWNEKTTCSQIITPTRKKKNLQKNKNEIQKSETSNEKTLTWQNCEVQV